MKQRFLFAIFLLASSLFVPAQAQAQVFNNVRTGDQITVPVDEVIDENFFIATGDQVEIFGTINGDLYAAGGQVLIEGAVNGDVIAAGGMVRITGTVAGNVRAAGGTLSISGNIGKNVTLAGGNLELSETAQISGGLLAAGGNVSNYGTIEGSVLIGAGNLVLSGPIVGDVNLGVGQLRITPTAQIGGTLKYNDTAETSISDAAPVTQTETYTAPQTHADFDSKQLEKGFKQFFQVLGWAFKAAGFVSALIVGLILVHFAPRYTKASAELITTNPFFVIVTGFFLLLFTPVLILFLMITFFGLPLAFFLMLLYFLYLYLAKIYVSYWLGSTLAKFTGQNINPYLIFILGLIVLFVLKSIPVLGWLISLFTVFLGLGAGVIGDKRFFKEARSKNIL